MFYLKNDRHLILLHRIVPFCKIDSKEGHDETSGTFQVLDNNVLMLVCPYSGEHTFYKVKDDNNIVMTDSVGNEPEGETARFYVLKKRK
jgi:lipoprotein nlpE